MKIVKNHSLYSVQHKSMVKLCIKGDDCTSWSFHINARYKMCSKRQFRDEIHNLSKKVV